MTTTDPLVEALARTILRHQLGCDQPAEPPAWMVAAATEIVDAINEIGWSSSCDFLDDGPFIDVTELAPELNRRHR